MFSPDPHPVASADPFLPGGPARTVQAPLFPVGYLIPEFPGQTHIWMWREISHLLEWGVPVRLFSTRRPPARDRARHAFAGEAEAETFYLWPRSVAEVAASLAWACRRPLRVWRALRLAARLPIDGDGAWRRVTPLLAPAAVLAREMERSGVRHLHVHSCSNSAVIAMLAGELTGIPYSLTLNANVEWWGGAVGEKFERAAFVIVITEWLLEQVRREYPELGKNHVLLGRIGVDTRKWRAIRRAGRAVGPWRVISVGRLHASKGHDVLVRAIAVLIRDGDDVDLRIVGAGPERGALERLARELGVGDRVLFTGSLSEEEVIAELGEADIFALASHAEPLGVVYMEAMAAGIPAIGTAAGGVGEIITDGVDGLLVPPGDPEALAGAIGRLIRDPGLRERLGAAGRARIERAFDSRIGAATLYERLFGRPAPRGEGTAVQEGGEGLEESLAGARGS